MWHCNCLTHYITASVLALLFEDIDIFLRSKNEFASIQHPWYLSLTLLIKRYTQDLKGIFAVWHQSQVFMPAISRHQSSLGFVYLSKCLERLMSTHFLHSTWVFPCIYWDIQSPSRFDALQAWITQWTDADQGIQDPYFIDVFALFYKPLPPTDKTNDILNLGSRQYRHYDQQHTKLYNERDSCNICHACFLYQLSVLHLKGCHTNSLSNCLGNKPACLAACDVHFVTAWWWQTLWGFLLKCWELSHIPIIWWPPPQMGGAVVVLRQQARWGRWSAVASCWPGFAVSTQHLVKPK